MYNFLLQKINYIHFKFIYSNFQTSKLVKQSPSLIVYFSTFTTKYQKEHASNSKPVGTWNGFMRSFGAIISSIVATSFLAITKKRIIYFFWIPSLVISKHDTHDNFFYHLCNSFKQSFCIVLFLPSRKKFKKSFSYLLLVHGQLETILCSKKNCTFHKIMHVLQVLSLQHFFLIFLIVIKKWTLEWIEGFDDRI